MRKKFLLFLFLFLFFITSCGFVDYIENVPNESEKLIESKSDYCSKLDDLSNLEYYYEVERAIYLKLLIEGKSQINESNDIDDIIEIFNNFAEKIKEIKKIEDYENELKAKKELYIEKIKSVSSSDNYNEKELEAYLDYIDTAVSLINDLTNADDPSFEKIYSIYKEAIENLKTIEDYIEEEKINFSNYKQSKIDEIYSKVDLKLYRANEKSTIENLLESYSSQITDASEKTDVDNLVRDFLIQIYFIKTDSELYNEELEELKRVSIQEFANYKNVSDYRTNEAIIILTIIESFNSQVLHATTKEYIVLLKKSYMDIIDSIKTDADLYEEERIELVEECYNELLGFVDKDSMDDTNYFEYLEYCNKIKTEMLMLETKEAIKMKLLAEKQNAYIAGAKQGDRNCLSIYQELLIDQLKLYLDLSLYRKEQKYEIDDIIAKQSNIMKLQITYDSTLEVLEETHNLLDAVLTNDQMWLKEDAEFFDNLYELYGESVLTAPKSLTEANDLYELADIIDYYAFYQLNATTFVRDSFRVNVKFSYKSATQIKNNVYWLCDLIRSTVGLKCFFEDDINNLVINLIPYNFASISNEPDYLVSSRYSNLCSLNADDKKRSEDFDDFAYKNYSKSVKVWNTQQLWYALQKNYLPICDENSIAEKTLNKAKEILREKVNDDMKIHEKIFNIFSWFSDNVIYDHKVKSHSPNMDEYPDETVSWQRSFFAEGAFFDGVAVCSGYAKAYLILLNIEGITAKHILAPANEFKGKDSINSIKDGNGFYSSHEFVFIKIENKWYYSDPEKSYDNYNIYFKSFIYMLLPPNLIEDYYTEMKVEGDLATEIYYPLYEDLSFNDYKLFNNLNIKEIINPSMIDSKNSLSIFVDETRFNEMMNIILELGCDFNVISKKDENGVGLSEITIYYN